MNAAAHSRQVEDDLADQGRPIWRCWPARSRQVEDDLANAGEEPRGDIVDGFSDVAVCLDEVLG